jgi:hypothetical protein
VTLKNEDQPPPSRETRSAESIQDSGPQYRRSVFSRPSRGNTWQQVEPSRRLAHRNSNAQKTAPSYPDTRSSESIQDLGPTATSDEFRTVRSQRDTWCAIRLHRLLALRNFEAPGAASSQLRDAKRRKHSGLGPTVSPKVISAVYPARTRGARLGPIASSRIATLKSKD